MGPFTLWPTGEGIGFDYFYGFLAGETSQWEPRLVENLNPVEPPARRELPPERGPGRQGDHLDAQASRLRPRQAVPHVLGAGRRRTDRTTSSRKWADKYKGKFDDGWDALRERTFARQKRARLDPRRHQADAASRQHGRVGQHPGGRAAVPAAADGGLRRLRRARRRPGREGGRRARAPRHPRQHDRDLHLRRQRLERRGTERQHQRAAGAERDPEHGRAAARGARTSSAASTRSAARRWTTCTTPAGPGPATRRSTTPSWSPRISAARAIRWPSRGRRASSPDNDAAIAVPSRQRRRADDLRHPRHHARRRSSTASSRTRSTASAWPTRSPTRRRPGASRPSTSTTTAAAASTRTAGSPARSGRSTPWLTVSPGLAIVGFEQGRLGALRSRDRFFAGRRPRGARTGAARRP